MKIFSFSFKCCFSYFESRNSTKCPFFSREIERGNTLMRSSRICFFNKIMVAHGLNIHGEEILGLFLREGAIVWALKGKGFLFCFNCFLNAKGFKIMPGGSCFYPPDPHSPSQYTSMDKISNEGKCRFLF